MKFTKRQITANRKAWIKALRSGKYQQTRGVLCRTEPSPLAPSGHCCLGVACEVLKERGVIREYDQSNGYPPTVVQEALGLTSYKGNYGDSDSLTSRNDCDRWSFKKIAALIERKPKGLFVEEERVKPSKN